jgi:hypothetical protein
MEFYGGPMDGKPVPRSVQEQDWLAYTMKHGNNVVTYLYMYEDDTDRFEFAGEEEIDEEEE